MTKHILYLEINPMFYGIRWIVFIFAVEDCVISSAKTFGFKDLSWIGVLSAIGDMQNNKTGHFEGLNEIIQEDAINEGLLKVTKNDLNIYGRSTRTVIRCTLLFQ